MHLQKEGFEVQCFAPFMEQHHVVDHRMGEEVSEFRNVLVESARISRGKIEPLSELDHTEFDCLVMPGGFGVAKNLTKWAFLGASGGIHPAVRDVVRAFVANRRPVLALCMASTTVAKAIQSLELKPTLTVGDPAGNSPYPVSEIVAALESTGAIHLPRAADEPCVDEANRIVTVPCYMMETDIVAVERGILAGVQATLVLSDAAMVSRITAVEEDSETTLDSTASLVDAETAPEPPA